MKKVLIIHGWVQSKEMFFDAVNDLDEEYEVEYFELPGFGDVKAIFKNNILQSYSDLLNKHLVGNNYDILLGHSLGAQVILRALKWNPTKYAGKIILLNPAYGSMYSVKTLVGLKPIVWLTFYMRDISPKKLSRWVTRKLLKFTVSDPRFITEELLEDCYRCDIYTMYKTLMEMVYERFDVRKLEYVTGVHVIHSSNDNLISRVDIDNLLMDIREYKYSVLRGYGHNSFIEDKTVLGRILRGEL